MKRIKGRKAKRDKERNSDGQIEIHDDRHIKVKKCFGRKRYTYKQIQVHRELSELGEIKGKKE